MNPDWHLFVRSEGPRLFRYFLARFDAPTADDLVQEVLMRVVRKCRSGDFDPSRGNLTALSFGIAHNIARETYRHNRRSLEDPRSQDLNNFEFATESPQIDESLSKTQELMRLKEAIGLLSSSEQEVISLLVSRDLRLPEIASVLDIPLNTVKSHIHRAKLKLREYLTTTTSTGRENL